MTVKQEFQTGTVGWEFLFIFIAGCLGDMFVHMVGELTNKKYGRLRYFFRPLAQGLNGYYESMETNFFGILKTPKSKSSAWFQGAIWGGIACVVALLIAKLFLFANEELHNE